MTRPTAKPNPTMSHGICGIRSPWPSKLAEVSSCEGDDGDSEERNAPGESREHGGSDFGTRDRQAMDGLDGAIERGQVGQHPMEPDSDGLHAFGTASLANGAKIELASITSRNTTTLVKLRSTLQKTASSKNPKDYTTTLP